MYPHLCDGVQITILVVLLLMLSEHTLTVAPGDEYGGCDIPDYPADIFVLLDSFRYRSLVTANADNAVWIASKRKTV